MVWVNITDDADRNKAFMRFRNFDYTYVISTDIGVSATR